MLNYLLKNQHLFNNLNFSYIHKSANVYNKVIDLAHKNKDYEFIVDSFLDILDHKETTLEHRLYNVVLVSNEKFVKDKPLKEFIEV